MYRAGAHQGISGVWARAMRFCSDRRGVAAIEFAFIVPVLLIMYFVTMEASQAIETSKKVSRIGSMVADLITQQQTIVDRRYRCDHEDRHLDPAALPPLSAEHHRHGDTDDGRGLAHGDSSVVAQGGGRRLFRRR